MLAKSCISSRCSLRTSLSKGVMFLRNLAGLPAQIYPSLMTTLSKTTAPAATKPPCSTVACLTVAPIEMKARSWIVDPCIIELGPMKTLLPILTSREMWVRSWITQFWPILIEFVPTNVAPYQMEDLYPTVTFPKIVAFGATKSAKSILGVFPSWVNLLKLGTSLSSLNSGPSTFFPSSYRPLPTFR